MLALNLNQLTKIYRNGTVALDHVNLTVNDGEFLGLLGPNGAGKSTLIRIINSLVLKTSGDVVIYGHDLDQALALAKSFIGVVPQEFNFGIFEKVSDIIVNQAGYYGLPRKLAAARTEHYLKLLDLWDKRNSQARMLSGGMKRRLMIARALVHNPKMLVLDEPTAGVDIELRRMLWEFLTEINQQEGKTIILTTHYLEEAERLCERIAIINHGKIIADAPTATLLSTLDHEAYVLDLAEPITSLPTIATVDFMQLTPLSLEISLPKTMPLNQVFTALTQHGITVRSLRNKANRLEELFLHLTKQQVEKSHADQ